MRFRAEIHNLRTLTNFTASLATLGHIAWVRLDNKDVRFTVIPDKGTQVWSVLSLGTIFTDYVIQSAAPENTINLEVPLAVFQRALKSATNAVGANLRLTKKDGVPLLSLTITTETLGRSSQHPGQDHDGTDASAPNGQSPTDSTNREASLDFFSRQDRETVVTQDIPIRVLALTSVEGLHEPRCREPDVHIVLPNLVQLKAISDRFTKLALSTKGGNSSSSGLGGGSGPKLELSANMHGCLRLALATDPLHISSLWTGLENPELDPGQLAEGGLEQHPSTRMKGLGDSTGQHGEEGWATVRVEGKDWGRVLSVGRLGGRVIACFCHQHALILYVFLPSAGGEDGGGDGGGESVLTVSRRV